MHKTPRIVILSGIRIVTPYYGCPLIGAGFEVSARHVTVSTIAFTAPKAV